MAQPIYLDPELQGIERQRQLAQALMQRGMKPVEGQMVSGRFVAPAWTQQLANMFDIYAGRTGVEEAEKKAQEYQTRQQQAAAQNIAEALKLSSGTPEQVTFSAEEVGPTRTVTPATAANPQAAIARLLRPNASAVEQNVATKLIERQFKEPKWEKVERLDQKTGNTMVGMIDVNSPQPEMTFREIGASKPAISQADLARLRFEGIPVGGSMGGVSMPSGGVSGGGMGAGGAMPVSMGGGAPTAQPRLETYQYNPNLSPKQNQELAKAFEEKQTKNISNAKESFEVIKQAADIFNTGAPSSGRLQNIKTGVAEFFDVPTQSADADAKLTILAQKLTSQVPRFEGPQSNVDVAMYQAAAGDVGNPNKTISTRLSALQTLIDLNKKYFPQGDWDKIDLKGPVTTRQTFTKGRQTLDPVKFREGLSPQDRDAFDWVRQNPNDPRAAKIKEKLGIR